MKRSTTIISATVTAIVVVALVCTGTAYFLGKQYQQKIATEFETINQQPNWQFAHLHLSAKNYQRGVFSSQFQIVISTDQQPLPLLVLNQTVHHGPFPLAEIARLNFMPSSAVETIPAKEGGSLNNFFTKLAPGKPLFNLQSRISYLNSNNISATFRITPVHYQQFDFAGAVINTTSHAKEKPPKNFNNLADLIKISPSGTISAEIGKITIRDAQHVFSIDSLTSDFQFSMNSKTFSQDIKFLFKGLTQEKQLIGDGNFSLHMHNLDTPAIIDYLQFIQNISSLNAEKNMDFLQQFQQSQKELEKHQDKLQQMLVAIIKNADITIDPISLRNDKGLLKYSLHLSLNDASRLASPDFQTNRLPILKDVLKSMDSKLELSKAASAKLLGQLSCITDGTDCDQEEKAAVQKVNMLSMAGQMFHVTTTDNNNITSHIQIKDGVVTVNGKIMPFEEFFELYAK